MERTARRPGRRESNSALPLQGQWPGRLGYRPGLKDTHREEWRNKDLDLSLCSSSIFMGQGEEGDQNCPLAKVIWDPGDRRTH